jgi:hypothetical protein
MRNLAVAWLLVIARTAAADTPHLEYAVRAGIGDANNADVDDSGIGPAIDVEVGARWRSVTVAGYATYFHFHDEPAPDYDLPQTVVDMRGNAVGGGGRVHLHIRHVFLGAGVGFEYWHEAGPEAPVCGDDGAPSLPAFSQNRFYPVVELHAGYTFSRVGRVAPQVMAVALGAPNDMLGWRVLVGVQF